LLNTTGAENVAVGTDALVFNDSGDHNNAVGASALFNNIDGFQNNAFGTQALYSNLHGASNTAVGHLAGHGITTANNNIVIGHGSGVHSVFGQVDNSCYIDNIFAATIAAGTATIVGVDADGKLGTVAVDANGNKMPLSSLIGQPQAIPNSAKPQAIPDAQALTRKVEALEATVAELKGQLKEQAAQIQRVSAQLEVSNPAAKVVLSNP
jgi:hypothetical protein